MPKQLKMTERCAPMLTLPYVGVPLTVLHKRVRLDCATARCRCILDDIGQALFSRMTSEIARHFFIIGIIHVFSCINIRRVSRKLFEPEAARFKLLPRDTPGS